MLPAHKIGPPDHLREIQVLVVDNDQRIRALVKMVLKHLGFKNIFEARDGFQSVKLMQKHDIDLVITDWDLQVIERDAMAGLPDNPVVRSEQWTPVAPENGTSFVRYLRASNYSPNPYVPIIMLTGLGLKDNVEYARDAGVNEILLKPLCVETLCQRIAMIIDFPRPFIVAECYKGPCRRRELRQLPGAAERRHSDIKIYRHT